MGATAALRAPPLPPLTLTDLPTDCLGLIAAALLRSCYADVHAWRRSPPPPTCWKPVPPLGGSRTLADCLLVDAPTWAAAAPASVACRRLRDALLAAVDGLALRVPTAVSSGTHAALAGAWGLASSLTAGAYADRYVGPYGDAAVGVGGGAAGTGAAGAVATALGRWPYFFPAVTAAGAADRTPALASFVRSVPALAGAVEVWDGHAGEGADGSSTQLLFLLRPPPLWRAAVTAAAAAEEAKAAAVADAAATAADTDGVGAADAGAAHGGDAVDDTGGGGGGGGGGAESVSSIGRLFLKGASPLQYAVAQHVGVPLCVFPDPDFGALGAAVARAAAAGAPTVVRHATLGMIAGVVVRTVGAGLHLYACDRSVRSDHECKGEGQAP